MTSSTYPYMHQRQHLQSISDLSIDVTDGVSKVKNLQAASDVVRGGYCRAFRSIWP